MTKAWNKARTRVMVNRRVTNGDLYKLWDALRDDGVWIKPTTQGYQFYAGQYRISNKSISQAWYVSENAVRRLALWLIAGNGDSDWE